MYVTAVYTGLNAQLQDGVSISHRSQEAPGTAPELKYF